MEEQVKLPSPPPPPPVAQAAAEVVAEMAQPSLSPSPPAAQVAAETEAQLRERLAELEATVAEQAATMSKMKEADAEMRAAPLVAAEAEAETAQLRERLAELEVTVAEQAATISKMKEAEPETSAVPPPTVDSVVRTSKLLCLIRHGQGVHNPRNNKLALGWLGHALRRDAPLTGKGRQQAAALEKPMHYLPFDLIVVSPLSRTIETATEAFSEHPTPKRLCHLMCERATMPSDLGTPKSQLLEKHPQIATWQGFDTLPEHFWPARSIGPSAEEEVAARVTEFKEWLLRRPETCLALVGHSAFFSTMTGLPKLANCEAFWCTLGLDGTISECTPLPPPPCADD